MKLGLNTSFTSWKQQLSAKVTKKRDKIHTLMNYPLSILPAHIQYESNMNQGHSATWMLDSLQKIGKNGLGQFDAKVATFLYNDRDPVDIHEICNLYI